MAAYVTFIYGVLVTAGGILGYAKKRSVPSLVMGGLFGLVVIACAILMFQENVLGAQVALGVSVFLAAFFAVRFWQSKKFMPAGLMVILSVIAAATLALAG